MFTKKVLPWDLIKILAIFTIISLSFPVGCECGDQTTASRKMSSETGMNDGKVPFIHVSRIGGMVGGFTAIAQSKYIGSGGLVQISKEETNGVLHMLEQGQLV